MPKIKVFLVDDHPVVRAGLAKLIEDQDDMMVCGQTECGDNALVEMKKGPPDVLVTDLSLQGMDGMDVIKQARSVFPKLGIVAFSVHDETVHAESVLRAGANGYVMKNEAASQIIQAIRSVLSGGTFLSHRLSGKMLSGIIGRKTSAEGTLVERLSDRELQVFRMIGEGQGSRQMAKMLALSVKTVETHVAHIKQKLGLSSLAQLIQYAVAWVKRNQG